MFHHFRKGKKVRDVDDICMLYRNNVVYKFVTLAYLTLSQSIQMSILMLRFMTKWKLLTGSLDVRWFEFEG